LRKILFIASILVGLAGGLLYGWVINPVRHTGSGLATLREDFRADYVLMTAEIFDKDHDLKSAAQRLSLLDPSAPTRPTMQAVLYARTAGYSVNDIQLLLTLTQEMQAFMPLPGGAQ
jgi:hypothetical protein